MPFFRFAPRVSFEFKTKFAQIKAFITANANRPVTLKMFHGTDMRNIASIVQNGFIVSTSIAAGRTWGDGIYATPNILLAARHGANVVFSSGAEQFAVLELMLTRPLLLRDFLIWDLAWNEEFQNPVDSRFYNQLKFIYGAPVAKHALEVARAEAIALQAPFHEDITIRNVTSAATRQFGFVGAHYVNTADPTFGELYVFTDSALIRPVGLRLTGPRPERAYGWEHLPWYAEAERIQREIGTEQRLERRGGKRF